MIGKETIFLDWKNRFREFEFFYFENSLLQKNQSQGILQWLKLEHFPHFARTLWRCKDQVRLGSRQVQPGLDCNGLERRQGLHLRVGWKGGELHWRNVHSANWTWVEAVLAESVLAEVVLAAADLAEVGLAEAV